MSLAALLAAVRAVPDGDLPRLAYADALDDVGEPARAEFIRVQCELATLPEWDSRRPALEDREHELLDAHEPAWLGGPFEIDEWEWRRGFVDEVTGDYITLHDSGAAGWSGHPVTTASVTELAEGVARHPEVLADAFWLRDIRRLSLAGNGLGSDGLRPFVRSPNSTELTGLDVSQNHVLDRLADTLADAAFLPTLRELTAGGRLRGGLATGAPEAVVAGRLAAVLASSTLERLHLPDSGLTGHGLHLLLDGLRDKPLSSLDVADNDLPAAAWEAFHSLPASCPLRRLDVSGTAVGVQHLGDLLSRCPALRGLTHLDANRCGTTAAVLGVRRSPFWRQAESLRMHSSWLDRAMVADLCRADGPPALRLLDVGDNRLTDAGAAEVCDAPFADALTWLALSNNALTDAAARHLAYGGRFRSLRVLHLAFNTLTDAGAAALAGAPALARLRLLTLAGSPLTARGVTTLLGGAHWRLTGLGLGSCGLGPEAARLLAGSPRLRRLQWLDLSANPGLGGDALLPLADSPHLSRLCELDIGGCDPSDRVRAALRQRLGVRLSD